MESIPSSIHKWKNGYFCLSSSQKLKLRSSWGSGRTAPNRNKTPLDKDLVDFLKLLNSEVPKFTELLTDQALYDAHISSVAPNNMSDLFELSLSSFPFSYKVIRFSQSHGDDYCYTCRDGED